MIRNQNILKKDDWRSEKIKVKKRIFDMFEKITDIEAAENIIYVLYQDLEGYYVYQNCADPFLKNEKMTGAELEEYERLWINNEREWGEGGTQWAKANGC